MRNRVRRDLEETRFDWSDVDGCVTDGSARSGTDSNPRSRAWSWFPAAPADDAARSICPHCWEVNPGPFRLCARCGADMRTLLQESGGMRRTAPVQSPVPVGASSRLGIGQRVVLGIFVVMMALSYAVYFLPQRGPLPGGSAPASAAP